MRRSCCRHLPKAMPTSSWKSLSTVLLLAPTSLQMYASDRRSLGSAKSISATRSALGSDGFGSRKGTCPPDLERMLPPPPPNYAHVVIGGNLVLLNRANFQI